MFVETEEIITHLYDEQVAAISGDDETMLTAAIDGAVAEAKGYLNGYDLDTIFDATGTDRHPLLLIFVKDIAVWHYLNIANPGTDLSHREKRYNAATAWLKGVAKGDIVPDLPAAEVGDDTPGQVTWGSNTQRVNHI